MSLPQNVIAVTAV